MPKILFNNYLWLINKLKTRSMTIAELAQAYERSSLCENGKRLTARTLYNWREKIAQLFGLEITCNGDNEYTLVNYDHLRNDSPAKWLLQSIAVSETLVGSQQVNDRILLERMPSGDKYLSTIIDAMRENRLIRVSYRRFQSPQTKEIVMEPWCVKVCDRRWYVLGNRPGLEKDPLRVYALDRMLDCSIVEGSSFVLLETFNAQKFFEQYYGVWINTDIPVQDVLVRIESNHCNYLYTLPLHSSQQEIIKNDEYSIFKYHLRPTVDFYRAILSLGADAEILEPKSLRETIAEETNLLNEIYNGSWNSMSYSMDNEPCQPVDD